MINVFYKNRNTIGQFMVALMFLGTFGFLFASDGFVSKSEATSCYCSGEAAVTSFAADSSGDYSSYVSIDAEAVGCCGKNDNPVPSGSNSSGCGSCDEDDCNCSSASGCSGSRGCTNPNTQACMEGGTNRCDCSSYCGSGGNCSLESPCY